MSDKHHAREDGLDRFWRHAGLVMAVMVMPVLYSIVTAEVAFERSKSVEFCASCHVMTPYVEDLKKEDSELLAAKHAQYGRIQKNQCYTCHADYDIFGGVKAKINGVQHMAHYYFSEERPIKLYKPFPNSHCMQCHEKAKSFVKSEVHQGVMDSLKSGETSCIECHGPVHPSHLEAKK